MEKTNKFPVILTENDVVVIKKLFRRKNPPTRREIAEKFNISEPNVSNIKNNYTWKHVEVWNE